MPYQVLHCVNDVAKATCSGSWDGATGIKIFGRVTKGEEIILDWQKVGITGDNGWEATIPGIPLGGPYTISFRVNEETCTVEEVLAGDLWVLAGQSNMQGVGNKIDVPPPNPLVHALAMNGKWKVASEPLHVMQESIDPVHTIPRSEENRKAAIEAAYKSPKGAGLGIPFAVEMVRRTGRPIGLICTAHGGTTMDQWDPEKKDMKGESLYGSMVAQVVRAGGKVRGVLWYQGESDANPDAAPAFQEKFEKLVAAIRDDSHKPRLPFYYVQIGRFCHPDFQPEPWNRVQAMQLAAEKTIPNSGMVASIDLALDDIIHVGTHGLKRLGNRLANLAEHDLFNAETLAGPRPESASFVETPHGKQIHVIFSGVNGKLNACGRPTGFSISSGPEGETIPFLYKVELPEDTPNTAILWVQKLPENACVWYGRGLDPYANITDEADMAVPVFGPLPVSK